MTPLQTGTIKKIKYEGGFGFIKTDEQGPDIFFHAKRLRKVNFDDLKEGQRVEFSVEESEKGLIAFNLNLID